MVYFANERKRSPCFAGMPKPHIWQRWLASQKISRCCSSGGAVLEHSFIRAIAVIIRCAPSNPNFRFAVGAGIFEVSIMTFSTTLLGSLVITSDICRIGKLPKKARGLIAYLAAQRGQPVSRERLADLLWPYQGSEQARHSLRNCLLELRKALGLAAARHLVAGFTSCQLRDVEIDLDEFERLSRSQQRSDLQAAADLYRNEFLADFHIASEPFQEWLAAERDRTLAAVCDVLRRLVALQDAAGEPDAAIR